ncbi:hypothetical protein GQ607_000928 [Colletotrichum asianum]|uniref:Uncharacterized protein n=1 Tax=Colletotrichum asianum TaxID=702518 RepID=A0A8H3ZTY4_9PEZI|nr:hypothetical protein GQ607_000928 [Colletotrichum asianum]
MVPPTRRYSLIQKYWLVNMGFSKEKAEQLWNSWCEIPDKPPMPADGLETKEMQKLSSTVAILSTLDQGYHGMYYKWLQRRVFEPERAMSTRLFLKPKEGTKFCDDYEFRPKHPGYIPLYMVVDEDRIHHVFDEQGNLDNLDQPRTTGASDFSSSPGCFYFIHQLKLAELHARYAKRRAGGASVAILCVFVSFQEYWRLKASGKALSLSGLDWLRFVWECRKGLSSSPSGLFDKYGKATLLYGNIPLYREYRRTRIKNETTSDVIRKLTWSHGGIERGRQCMFSASAGERFLREHAKFRILAYQDL